MKKNILILAVVLLANFSFSQNFKKLVNYEFKTEESYTDEMDKVLECANYLFENPNDENELNRLIATQYIMNWMNGTPDYTFEIGDDAMSLTKGKQELLGLYLAAMTKVVLDNPEEELSNKEIHNQSQEILVKYCSDENNNIKPSKKIKKIIKSRK
jgi:hypothetical protein